jgi:peptidoglycan/LPS O-acetylase OafA/YrhL
VPPYLLFRPWLYGPVATGPYLARRFLRIYPGYLFALVGVGILTADPAFFRDPIRFLLLAQNYDQATFQTYIGPTWSLVLEATFYLTLPVLGTVLAARRPALQLGVLAGLGLASWFAGAALRPTPMHGGWILSLYPLMFWAFVPGMLTAVLERAGWLRRELLVVGAIAFGALGLGTVLPQDMGAWAIAGGCLIGLLLSVRRVPGSSTAADLSYGVYLWHDPLIGAFGPIVGGAGALAAAAVSWRFVESPAIELGRRISRRAVIRRRVETDAVVVGLP